MALAQAQRNADYQRTVELVNRFTVSTVQFLNRFAAMCEDKIQAANRSLQHIEVQVKLLEVKLDSTEDSDGDGEPRPLAASSKPQAAAPPPAIAATKTLQIAAPPPNKPGPPPPPGFQPPQRNQPPPMGGFSSNGGGPPPPPGYKGPPLPPGMTPPPPNAAPLALMAPPSLGQPPPGFMPPPPPMPMGNANPANQTRNHPRLVGYFKMQEAGVPVAAIKAKMTADGMNPVWLDAPDAPAPSGIPPLKNDTLYDSD